VLLALGLAACGEAGADPELLGDRAYGAGKFSAAAARYGTALAKHPGGRLWAKAAAASLHSGDLTRAGQAYEHLGTDDPTRVDEAADGLARVAHAAELAGDTAALEAAVLGLRRVAPARPALRYALAAAQARALPPAEALTVLPQALAAADDPRLVNTLLLRYGTALEQTAACDDAVLAWQAVLRRSADSALRTAASTAVSGCALRLGLGALAGGRPADAERWLDRAAANDSSSWTGRRALIGLGDAHRERGDTAGAIVALQAALAHGAGGDSLSQLAAGRLNALAHSQSAGDTTRKSPQ
jgi:tetratricopeptide (TPR) repeat protein